jgi:hypothetical protein
MEPTTGPFSVTEEPDSVGPVAPHEAFLTVAVGLMPGATVLAAAPPPESAMALALVSGQILECSLKAFLSKCGLDEEKLKRTFGHNLLDLWRESVTKGLRISATPPHWAETLNSLHYSLRNSPTLRYPMGLNVLLLPNAQETTSELRNLIDTVRKGMDAL